MGGTIQEGSQRCQENRHGSPSLNHRCLAGVKRDAANATCTKRWSCAGAYRIHGFEQEVGSSGIIHKSKLRHSGEGRNPVRRKTPRSGQNCNVFPLAREMFEGTSINPYFVIPAKAGIQSNQATGCRIKPGMTIL
jgi:hypothetical protein